MCQYVQSIEIKLNPVGAVITRYVGESLRVACKITFTDEDKVDVTELESSWEGIQKQTNGAWEKVEKQQISVSAKTKTISSTVKMTKGQVEQSGEYNCGYMENTKAFKMIFNSRITFVESDSAAEKVIIIGKDKEIVCKVEPNDGTVKITWTDPNGKETAGL